MGKFGLSIIILAALAIAALTCGISAGSMVICFIGRCIFAMATLTIAVVMAIFMLLFFFIHPINGDETKGAD